MWSLNRLMDMIGTLATRVVATEPRAAGQRRWQGWEQICGALHLEEEPLLVALGPQAKALLLWMQGGVVGRQAVAFQVQFGSWGLFCPLNERTRVGGGGLYFVVGIKSEIICNSSQPHRTIGCE